MITIIPVMIIIYGLSSFITGALSSSAMKDQILEHSRFLSRSYADHLESRISQYLNISEDLSSAVITSIHIETTLKAYKKRYPQFSNILYTSVDGKVRDMVPFSSSLTPMDLSGLEEWHRVEETRVPILSEPGLYFGAESVILLAPVLLNYVANQEPDFLGTVALVLPLDELFKDISREGENSSSLFIIDSHGTLLFHKNHDLVLKGTMDDFSSLVSLSDISDAMTAQQTGFAAFSDRNSRKYISFTPISPVSWSLGVMGSYSDITAEIRRILFTSFTIVLLGIIAGGVIMYFVVHRVVRPIEDLTLMAKKIAEGDKTVQSDYRSESEVGQLSQSINSMVFQLREHQLNLERIVDERTMELQRTNDELGETVDELNTSNASLQDIRESLEMRVQERTLDLEKAHHSIDNIINSMPSVIIGVDPEGVVTQWNKQAEARTGLPGAQAVGKALDQVLPRMSYPADKVRDAIMNRVRFSESNHQRSFDDKLVYEDLTVYPLSDDGAEGAVIRIDDVTQRVLLEESLRQSQKQDVIGQLAGGIAHDFNNMLGGILGASELLKSMVKENPQAETFLSMIIESAKRASDLTDKLLIFSRRHIRETVPVDVHSAVDGAVALLERSLDKSIRIRTALNASESVVSGDFTQIQSVIMNLAINAAHAMPQGGEVVIESQIVEVQTDAPVLSPFDLAPGKYLEVSVKDKGIGISPGHMEKIFEPFFTTKKEGLGTGLGLAAVFSAMVQHKGAVTVESLLDEGSTFRLYLPVIQEATITEPDEDTFISGKGCILMVDDEEVLRLTTDALLRSLGYEVLLAENGRQGVEVFKDHYKDIDLILIDMIMPEMNGRDTFAAMKEIDPDARAVLISGFSNESNVNHFTELGFYAYLQKPVKGALLSRVVADAIGEKPHKDL